MTDCIHCHKLYTGNCKQCPGHIAELKAVERKINEHLHNLVTIAWNLQPDGSNPSETHMVSVANHLTTPLTPMHLETQSRHTLSYPKTCFKNVPGSELVASLEDVLTGHQLNVGSIPTAAVPGDVASLRPRKLAQGTFCIHSIPPFPCAYYIHLNSISMSCPVSIIRQHDQDHIGLPPSVKNNRGKNEARGDLPGLTTSAIKSFEKRG